MDKLSRRSRRDEQTRQFEAQNWVQKSEIEGIEVEETTKKGRNRETLPLGQEGNKSDHFMGVLYRDGDPSPDLPRAQLFGRENIDLDKMKEIRL